MGKRVLVVDDSQSIRQHVGATLVAGGFEVVEAVDGVDALEQLTIDLEVALVICDVNMPRLNGLELLEKLQASGKLDRLLVVMLTTEGQPAMMQRAKQAGAKGWIVKPFKPPLLLAAIQKLTGQ
jgi:two-component system, chemotaxis family, chemotaxis protein CheY